MVYVWKSVPVFLNLYPLIYFEPTEISMTPHELMSVLFFAYIKPVNPPRTIILPRNK